MEGCCLFQVVTVRSSEVSVGCSWLPAYTPGVPNAPEVVRRRRPEGETLFSANQALTSCCSSCLAVTTAVQGYWATRYVSLGTRPGAFILPLMSSYNIAVDVLFTLTLDDGKQKEEEELIEYRFESPHDQCLSREG